MEEHEFVGKCILACSCLAVLFCSRTVEAQNIPYWRSIGLDSLQISAVFAHDDTIWVGAPTVWSIDGVVQRSDVYCSVDGGKTWSAPFPADTCQKGCYNLLGVDPRDIARGFVSTDSGRAIETTDMGRTWKQIWNTGGTLGYIDVSHFEKDVLLADVPFDGLYLSRNDGDTWTQIDISPGIISTGISAKLEAAEGEVPSEPNCYPGETIYGILDPADSSGVYESVYYQTCGAYGEGFYSSRDFGSNWSQDNAGGGFPFIGDAEHPGRLYANVSNGGTNVQTSPDSGRSWYGMTFPDSIVGNWSGIVSAGTAYFVFATGVYMSTDQGSSWEMIPGSDRLPMVTSYSPTHGYAAYGGVAFDSTTGILYVGTTEGLYAYNLVTGIDSPTSLPTRIDLYQNYPNPFNPTTFIDYQLPTASIVTLKIYDVLGREVATLVNGHEAAGTHTVTFSGDRLPSGVYFYRISSSGYFKTMKMELLK